MKHGLIAAVLTATGVLHLQESPPREWVDRDYRILEGERVLEERLAELRKKAKAKIFAERVTRDLGSGGDWGD